MCLISIAWFETFQNLFSILYFITHVYELHATLLLLLLFKKMKKIYPISMYPFHCPYRYVQL